MSGFYLDSIAFDSSVMRRMRRAAEEGRRRRGHGSDLHFDLHPNNKTLVYLEHLPYFDSTVGNAGAPLL